MALVGLGHNHKIKDVSMTCLGLMTTNMGTRQIPVFPVTHAPHNGIQVLIFTHFVHTIKNSNLTPMQHPPFFHIEIPPEQSIPPMTEKWSTIKEAF